MNSVPRKNMTSLSNLVKAAAQNQGMSRSELAERSSLSEASVAMISRGFTQTGAMSLWALVGLADALGMKPEALVETVSPGAQANVRLDDIVRARKTVAKRLKRQSHDDQGIISKAAITGRPTMEPVKVPSALDLMVKIKQLTDEDRMLVGEFIDEVLAG